MLCTRCGGLLVRERHGDADGMSSTERIDCERCLNCGALEDPIIRANRRTARNPERSRKPRGPRIRHTDLQDFMNRSIHSTHLDAHHESDTDRHYAAVDSRESGPSSCSEGVR